MKKIDIQLLQQKSKSQECGPVCVQMVLNHFNIHKDFESLKGYLTFYENGTSAYDNGSLLLAEGLNVTAITAHPYIFPPDIAIQLDSKEQVLDRIDHISTKRPKFKNGLETMKKFLNDGGDLKIEIPSFNHIKNAIDGNSLVIALLYGGALGSKEGGFHFVVVSGYDIHDSTVLINNPLPISKGNQWFPVENFLYAVHTSTTFDIDNGTLLVISK